MGQNRDKDRIRGGEKGKEGSGGGMSTHNGASVTGILCFFVVYRNLQNCPVQQLYRYKFLFFDGRTVPLLDMKSLKVYSIIKVIHCVEVAIRHMNVQLTILNGCSVER